MYNPITSKRAIQSEARKLDDHLRSLFGDPQEGVKWDFPKPGGGPDKLPTWSIKLDKNSAQHKYLIIGFTPRFRWHAPQKTHLKRCPVLLSFSDTKVSGRTKKPLTSIVEVNIPNSKRTTVNGCFAYRKEEGPVWLLHRGKHLTVHGNQHPTQEQILKHFKKNYDYRLKKCLGPKGDERLIPVVKTTARKSTLIKRLVHFLKTVQSLKESEP